MNKYEYDMAVEALLMEALKNHEFEKFLNPGSRRAKYFFGSDLSRGASGDDIVQIKLNVIHELYGEEHMTELKDMLKEGIENIIEGNGNDTHALLTAARYINYQFYKERRIKEEGISYDCQFSIDLTKSLRMLNNELMENRELYLAAPPSQDLHLPFNDGLYVQIKEVIEKGMTKYGIKIADNQSVIKYSSDELSKTDREEDAKEAKQKKQNWVKAFKDAASESIPVNFQGGNKI